MGGAVCVDERSDLVSDLKPQSPNPIFIPDPHHVTKK